MKTSILISILLLSLQLSMAQDCANHCCENYGGSCCTDYFLNGKFISTTDTFFFLPKENGLFLKSSNKIVQIYHCDRQVVMPEERTVPYKGFIRTKGENADFYSYQIVCDRHYCEIGAAIFDSSLRFYPGFMSDFYPHLKELAKEDAFTYFYSPRNKWVLRTNNEDYYVSKDGGKNYEKLVIIDDSMGTEAIAKFASASQYFTMYFGFILDKKGNSTIRGISFSYNDYPNNNVDFYLF
jgi:hypothetical protein